MAVGRRLSKNLPRSCWSSDVDMRAAVPIGLGTAYYLAGDGSDFANTEDQEAD